MLVGECFYLFVSSLSSLFNALLIKKALLLKFIVCDKDLVNRREIRKKEKEENISPPFL